MSDEVLGALSRPLQRRVLLTVAACEEPIALDTLGDKTMMDAHRWNEHQIALYHLHLPQLADMELIHWDRQDRIIKEGERFEEVRPLLNLIDDEVTDDNDRFSLSFGIMIAGALV